MLILQLMSAFDVSFQNAQQASVFCAILDNSWNKKYKPAKKGVRSRRKTIPLAIGQYVPLNPFCHINEIFLHFFNNLLQFGLGTDERFP